MRMGNTLIVNGGELDQTLNITYTYTITWQVRPTIKYFWFAVHLPTHKNWLIGLFQVLFPSQQLRSYGAGTS